MVECANCRHQHAPTWPELCTLLGCDCDEKTFVPLTKSNDKIDAASFEYYVGIIAKLTDIELRIRYMLEHIPGMRNTDDWQFVNQYWHYYLGFCTGMIFTTELYNKIHNESTPDSITRMRRKICQPDHQAIVILQEQLKGNPDEGIAPLTPKDGRYYEVHREIKRIISESKYLPTDLKLLKSKGIKADATKEAVMVDYQ